MKEGRTRGKFKHGKFQLDIRRKMFRTMVVKHQHRLTREAIESPSLEILKTQM